MNRVLTIGILSTIAGLIGYTLGITAPYPGRAVAIPGIMVGITLLSIGLWGDFGGMKR